MVRKIKHSYLLSEILTSFPFPVICYLLAAYAIVVRSSEYDLPPEMLDDIVALSLSRFGGNRPSGLDLDVDHEEY